MAQSSGAIVAHTEGDLRDLISALEILPRDMIIFSLSMRNLSVRLQSTPKNEHTTDLNVMNEEIRKQAVVYNTVVLPHAVEAMRAISAFLTFFTVDLPYEVMVKCWKNLLGAINKMCSLSEIVQQMHVKIMTDVKALQDKFGVNQGQMAQKQRKYEDTAKGLKVAAIVSAVASGVFMFGGIALAVPTGGASLATGAAAAVGIGTAIGSSKNAKDARTTETMVIIVSDIMLPALTSFEKGLEACYQYANDARETLIVMNETGKNTDDDNIEFFFLVMRAQAKEISDVSKHCREFIRVADLMRAKVACIPGAPGDKEYAKRWLEELKKNIKIEDVEEHFNMLTM